MNTPQLTEDAEGCSSGESGWTKYLASPFHGDGDGYSEVEFVLRDDDEGKGYDSKNSDDDSMASDASTGLVQSKNSHGIHNESIDMAHSQHYDVSDGDEDISGIKKEECPPCSPYSYKKFYKVEEARNRRTNDSRRENDASCCNSNSKMTKKKFK